MDATQMQAACAQLISDKISKYETLRNHAKSQNNTREEGHYEELRTIMVELHDEIMDILAKDDLEAEDTDQDEENTGDHSSEATDQKDA